MFVSQAMTRHVDTVSPDDTLRSVWEHMKQKGYEAIPVKDPRTRQLMGLVTVVDITNCVMAGDDVGRIMATPVRDVMSADPVTIGEDEVIEEAAQIMYDNDYFALPVTASTGSMIGIITQADVGRTFVKMLGFTEPGSRITLHVPDRKGVLADIVQVVKSCGISIASLATYIPEGANTADVVLRLKTDRPRECVQKLRDAGYRVLHVSQVWK